MDRHIITGVGLLATMGLIFALLGFSNEVWAEAKYGRRAEDTHWRLSMATGSSALIFLSAALAIGPIRRLWGRPTPVHMPWRRSIGVCAAVAVWIHVSFGITIHANGWRVWVPFTHLWRSSGSLFVLGAAFWIGLMAASLMSVLALTSNSRSLRTLGVRRWKLVQRSTYLVYPLVFVHILGVQRQEGRLIGQAVLPLLLMAVVIVAQIAGFVSTRRGKVKAPPRETGRTVPESNSENGTDHGEMPPPVHSTFGS